jgi:hypothetical protein
MKETTFSERISSIISFIILFLLAFGFTATAFSQTPQEYSAVAMLSARPQQDGIRMHDGRVWLTKSGNTTLLEKEIVITGGTHIKPDGSVVTKSGYTATLQEGDFIDRSGKLISGDSKVVAAGDSEEDENGN